MRGILEQIGGISWYSGAPIGHILPSLPCRVRWRGGANNVELASHQSTPDEIEWRRFNIWSLLDLDLGTDL